MYFKEIHKRAISELMSAPLQSSSLPQFSVLSMTILYNIMLLKTLSGEEAPQK